MLLISVVGALDEKSAVYERPGNIFSIEGGYVLFTSWFEIGLHLHLRG